MCLAAKNYSKIKLTAMTLKIAPRAVLACRYDWHVAGATYEGVPVFECRFFMGASTRRVWKIGGPEAAGFSFSGNEVAIEQVRVHRLILESKGGE
jgi:hypothetical protein